ncbi:hypothetical protein BTE28158_01882 [Burkholderia territorii]|nr:hypothetical protein BTE28158_01882 [Burkholderia territorii]
MPWPIPELSPSELPKPIDWRIWSLVFVAVFGLSFAAVVFFWPQGRTTHTAMFWTLVAGAPLSLFAILFGVKLNDWEQRQLEHEERVRENERLMSLWHTWANRGIFVANATCLPGGVENTDGWERLDYSFPVNLGRGRALDCLEPIAAEKRHETVIALIADRFSKQLLAVRSLNVLVLLDEKSAEDMAQWDVAVRAVLSTHPIRLSVDCIPASGDLSSLSIYVDQNNMPPTLIIAGQFWTAGVNPGYSEGVAGILMCSMQSAVRTRDENALAGCRLLRPMLSATSEIGADLHQATKFQVGRNSIQCAWLGALDMEAVSALRLEMGRCLSTKEAAIRDMDEVLGIPGPVSPWLTLAIAVEMGLRSGKPQLAAICDSASKRSVLCTLLPEKAKDQST